MAAQERSSRPAVELAGATVGHFGHDSSSCGDALAPADRRFWPTMLLVVLCQIADLVTFNLAVEVHGVSGELGPLGVVYRMAGFWGVAVVKLGLIGVVLVVLERYPWQRLSTR